MNLLFLGPPGSGKGTQAVRVAKKLGVVHFSTGEILRDAIKHDTDLGKKAKVYMEKGDLVPDEVLVSMIQAKIASGELSQGFILDGFPRTLHQAECLKEMLAKNNIVLDKAVLLDVSDEEIVKRLSGRWHCPVCGAGYNYPAQVPKVEGHCDNENAELVRRHDDEVDVVQNRLEVYKKQTEPIVAFYKNESILAPIDGHTNPDEVFQSLVEVVK